MKEDKWIVILLLSVLVIGLALSVFRYAEDDEAHYLREAQLINNSLKNFHWFGNEMVGLHGFLFKLPAALLFFVSGSSIFTATFTNILLGILSIFLCYLICLEITSSKEWAVAASFLVATSVHFVRVLPTFLREFPVMFSLLLLVYFIMRRKNIWLIGLILLLILDAKEGVFFAILPGLMVWIVHHEYLSRKRLLSFRSISHIFAKGIIVLLPAIAYILLMTTTGIIPLNVKLTSSIGLNNGGIREIVDYQKKNVEGQYNNWILRGKTTKIDDTDRPQKNYLWEKLSALINLLILYFRKILYFRTFSLSSVPRFIIFPAFVMSFVLFKKWQRSREKEKLVLVYLFWSYLLVFIVRSSHGRYLLPIIPFIFMFFIFFLRDGIERNVFFRNVLIGTTIFMILGLLFEREYLAIKICILLIVMAAFLGMRYLQSKDRSLMLKLRWGTVFLIGFCTFSIQIAASFLIPGQIGRYAEWGQNGQFKEITRTFHKRESVWININSNLLKIFAEDDMSISFMEGNPLWDLKDNVPKKALLIKKRAKFVFSFPFEDSEHFLRVLREHHIKKIVMVVSTSAKKDFSFPKKQYLQIFKNLPYLKMTDVRNLRKKVMYTFERIDWPVQAMETTKNLTY